MITPEEMPTPEMLAEGQEALSCLFDASIQKALGGQGGCKHFELQWFPARFRDLILMYLDDTNDFDSVAVSYIAMHRVRPIGGTSSG